MPRRDDGAGFNLVSSRDHQEWFVLRTKYAQEKRAQRELTNQGLTTFLPLRIIHRRATDGHKIAERIPLFGRYIFARLSWRLHCGSVMSTRGVQSFVGYQPGLGAKAPVVPYTVIRELKNRLVEINGYPVIIEERSPKPVEIHPDMMVRILFGPFRDHVVKVKGVRRERAEVLIGLLGKTFSYRLPREHLTLAA